ncbi:hypothetical protein [Sphingorhabdus sp. 109]|jgi:hypothetical protein|uniref:hypothetical protein n=1 Tax=Sphingorhabdus sp. 109 TaxID=2653173 RepID=UPI0012EEF8DE|nr:hypothetical protein [Sphingorhabdus sp. 109]VWX56609.1 conserved exported hypothetical protein [Sphingorhabdus sp. 109]
MHSNNSQKRLRRLTPFLIGAGLGLSVAAHAAEPETTDEAPPEIPAPTIDTDGDGSMDAWDRNGDRKPDAWDSDGDGQPDLLDNDGDGEPD